MLRRRRGSKFWRVAVERGLGALEDGILVGFVGRLRDLIGEISRVGLLLCGGASVSLQILGGGVLTGLERGSDGSGRFLV